MGDEGKTIKSPRIAAIGGGTGLSTLLRGLKDYTEDITAIVTVADDGGSSGMLRQDLGILPPGDIRNCILALANVEPLMERLYQYRFSEGGLKGQNFGNIFIAAMNDLCGGFKEAVKQTSSILAVTGTVLPVTLSDLVLCARLENGTMIRGESRIPQEQIKANSPIDRVFMSPSDAEPLQEVLDALADADCITLGPGSLYTSILPNLIIPGISEAIRASKAVKVYIANVMTQPGETTNYTLYDHIKAIEKHCGSGLIDKVIVNKEVPTEDYLVRYNQENSKPVLCCDGEKVKGIEVIEENLLDYFKGYLRHNPQKLARCIINII